ncbi:ATP-binding protein [Streptoverticillium reticulum]|uniref:ATP-binding protein n=1 Tax=Streptoverticillium reticulum TaxID=1433415 RepID=UPI0039BF354D
MAIRPQRSGRQLTMDLVLRPTELAKVRRIVHSQLQDWNLAAQADDVVTVVNELLTNVVEHVPGASCKLILMHKAHLLHVRVSDDYGGMPIKQTPQADRTTGRGLALVDVLTHGCWNVVAQSPGGGKEIHCLFDISQGAPPTKTVSRAHVISEIHRYGIAHPEWLTEVIHYAPLACDHLATGERCGRRCLTVTVGSVVHSGDRVRLLDGALKRQDKSLEAAALRITVEATGLLLEPTETAMPLWIEQRRPALRDNRPQRDRLHFWYLFEASPDSPESPRDRYSWLPIGDLPLTPLRNLVPTAPPRASPYAP